MKENKISKTGTEKFKTPSREFEVCELELRRKEDNLFKKKN